MRRKLSVFSLDAIVDVHRRVEWVTKGAARIRTETFGQPSGLHDAHVSSRSSGSTATSGDRSISASSTGS